MVQNIYTELYPMFKDFLSTCAIVVTEVVPGIDTRFLAVGVPVNAINKIKIQN